MNHKFTLNNHMNKKHVIYNTKQYLNNSKIFEKIKTISFHAFLMGSVLFFTLSLFIVIPIAFSLVISYNLISFILNFREYNYFRKKIKNAQKHTNQSIYQLINSNYLAPEDSISLRKEIMNLYPRRNVLANLLIEVFESASRNNFSDTFESSIKNKILITDGVKSVPFSDWNVVENNWLRLDRSRNSLERMINYKQLFKLKVYKWPSKFSKQVLNSLKHEKIDDNLELFFQEYIGNTVWSYEIINYLKKVSRAKPLTPIQETLSNKQFAQVHFDQFIQETFALCCQFETCMPKESSLYKFTSQSIAEMKVCKMKKNLQLYLETKNLGIFYYQYKLDDIENKCYFFKIIYQK